MNCKPGDLAIVIRESKRAKIIGKIVEVLYLAPTHKFKLPDGYLNEACSGQAWVCKLAHEIRVDEYLSGAHRVTKYVIIPDWALRPIRPGDLDESIDEAAPVADGLVI